MRMQYLEMLNALQKFIQQPSAEYEHVRKMIDRLHGCETEPEQEKLFITMSRVYILGFVDKSLFSNPDKWLGKPAAFYLEKLRTYGKKLKENAYEARVS